LQIDQNFCQPDQNSVEALIKFMNFWFDGVVFFSAVTRSVWCTGKTTDWYRGV